MTKVLSDKIKNGILLIITGAVLSSYMIFFGDGASQAAAEKMFYTSRLTAQFWNGWNTTFRIPGSHKTEPGSGNPVLVDNATALDAMLNPQAYKRKFLDYMLSSNLSGLFGLQGNVVLSNNRYGTSYKVQNIDLFKVSLNDDGSFVNYYMNVPEDVVKRLVRTHEKGNTFNSSGDADGVIRYMKSERFEKEYHVAIFFDDIDQYYFEKTNI